MLGLRVPILNRLQIESSCEEEVPSLADFTLEPIHAYQRKLTPSVKTVLVEEYLSNLSPYDWWARITSAGSSGASNWLTAVPGESSQNLTSEQFRVALSSFLGDSVFLSRYYEVSTAAPWATDTLPSTPRESILST